MVAEEIKKNQEHANMEHVKSKGTNLQNTKTFKDSKHKETNPEKFEKLTHKFEKPRNKPINSKPRKIRETNPQIRETRKQTQKF